MTRSGSPEGSPPDLREAAEDLWEQIGGELCICQHPEVPHWCERCQGRIDVIMAWMRSAPTGDTPPPELWTLLHWAKPDVQPPEQYSDEAKQGWRQAMAQGRTILSFHERGIAGANVGDTPPPVRAEENDQSSQWSSRPSLPAGPEASSPLLGSAAAMKDLEDWLRDSVRGGYLFGCYDEPLDEAGKRVVRAIIARLER